MNSATLNQIQRGTVRIGLPDFRPNGYEGKGVAEMYTDHLKPCVYLEKKRKGYKVPTFDDLIHGIQYLPSGVDARSRKSTSRARNA
jgi:hypothetical protein